MVAFDLDSPELRALVRDYDMAYDVASEQRAIARRPPAPVGYRLRLIGNASQAHAAGAPGCPVCQSTYQALVRVVNAVLPAAGRPTRYELGPFDASWHMTAARPHGVELSIVLLGRRDAGEPLDACQRECLGEIERGLRTLGVAPVKSSAGRERAGRSVSR
jgi:hypothetical protein